MSVAENEAREEYWNEYGLQAVMLRTAYVTGRTAEPCKEQVEAATRERSRHQIAFSIDGIRKCCSCGAAVGFSWGDDRVAFERHVTTMMLEAARKAVM